METSTVIKYGAYALAAYVVYRYASNAGWLHMFAGGPVAAGAAAPAAQPSATPPAAPAVGAPPDDAVYLRAVVDATYASELPVTVALNADQWNYYRTMATGQPQPDPLSMGFTSATRMLPITARQYWDALQVSGMSGFRGGWAAYDGLTRVM